MDLPVAVPLEPMLAKAIPEVPEAGPKGAPLSYEPKWDGFRGIVYFDGEDVEIGSRGSKTLTRYFPELVETVREQLTEPCVLDGEIIVRTGRPGAERLSWEALSQRIHPAESRIRKLATETPASFVAFDALASQGRSLLDAPFAERRAELERTVDAPVDLTPWTHDVGDTEPWLRGAEGVIAKEVGAPYRPGERTGMVKIKRVRTIDAVVRGWRPGKEEGTVGSLILGLYDEHGELREVGHTSGFTARQKRELVAKLAPYETGRTGSGEPSRWASDRELEWRELRSELVVEVSFDHVSDGRIRHGAKIQRWREDKDPRECTIAQLEQ